MNRRAAWIALSLTLGAFALRLYRLDHLALRGDESFTVLFVAQPLAEMWDGIRNVEPNPPLYYFLLRGATLLFGESDFAARLVSALLGVLAVPLIYRLALALLIQSQGSQALRSEGTAGRRLPVGAGESVALVATLLLAVNPYQIWHSQDVRNYTLWPALSLASLCFLMKALRSPRGGRPWLWVGYVATALLSLYTHYYDVFSLLFQNAFVLLCYGRERPILRRWIASQVILALLYLPWLLFGSSRPLSYQDATADLPGLLGMAGRSLAAFSLGETLPEALVTVLLPALVLLLILGLVSALRRDSPYEDRRHLFAFLALYLAVPILCLFALAQWRPLFRVRYLNVIAPAYVLVFALGLVTIARRRLGTALAGLTALALLIVPGGVSLAHYYYDPAYAKSADWRGLAGYLEAHAFAGDVIVQNYPDPTLAHYYRGPAERVVLPHRSAVDQVGNLSVNRLATGRALEQLLEQHRRLWLLPYRSEWDPEGFVQGWLDRRATRVAEAQVDVFPLLVYERADSAPATISYPQASRLDDAVQLLGYNLHAEGSCKPQAAEGSAPRILVSNPATCVLALTLHWQATALMDVDYTVFTHLIDREGRIWAQQDSQPQGGTFPTSQWLPGDQIADEYRLQIDPGAPPGDYGLEVGMYELETVTRLPAWDPGGDRWPLDAISLTAHIAVQP